MEVRSFRQMELTEECWSIQMRGKESCKSCDLLDKPECGGKDILKTGKNKLGLPVPIGKAIGKVAKESKR